MDYFAKSYPKLEFFFVIGSDVVPLL